MNGTDNVSVNVVICNGGLPGDDGEMVSLS